jgi:hypothetical protein
MYNLELILVFQMMIWFQTFYVVTTQFFSYVTKKIPLVLCNPKVRYGLHKGQPHVSILSQINPAHTLPSCLRRILMLSYLRLAFPNFLFPLCSPPKLSMQFSFPPPPNAPHAPPVRFDHPNKIWWKVQIMVLLIVPCPPVFLGTYSRTPLTFVLSVVQVSFHSHLKPATSTF